MAILESLPLALALSIVFVVLLLAVLLLVLLWGMHLGQQLAVDQTRRQGSFPAYGKRWVATEVEPQQRGHVPPRPMPPPATVRQESEAPR
ncbi:MAG: hypothetical protein KA760_11520 [Steroidobacteraceae bacterium]|nr:hypothetical protein [Steroidobacteraceae bacterium]